MRKISIALSLMAVVTVHSQKSKKPLPIIDMQLHALPANWEGPPPVGMCSPFEHWSVRDPQESGEQYYINTLTKNHYCSGKGFQSPSTDDSLIDGNRSDIE